MSRLLPFFLVALASVVVTSAESEKKLWAKSFLGKPAPRLEVGEWLTRKPDTTGNFVLVDFWATWCGPCRRAIPDLNEIHGKLGHKVSVIGLSNEEAEKVRKMEEPKINYFSAVDTLGRMKNAVEVQGIPHALLIDPDGIVRWEGFPLLPGHELTVEVVQNIVEEYEEEKRKEAAEAAKAAETAEAAKAKK